MKTMNFGNGDKMPLLGLGTWKSAPGEVYACVREAIRVGYRHIDCALVYGNEAEIGKALHDAIAAGDVTRKELWVTSKLWNQHHSPEAVGPALAKTLADLGLEYLDLYLVHWPLAFKPDVFWPEKGSDILSAEQSQNVPTWKAMEATVKAGLVRHIGVSNFSVKKLAEILANCSIKPEMNQVELHPLLQQKELLEYCAANGVGVTSYASLGSMDRPDFLKAKDEPSLLENPTIKAVASERGCTPAQVLLAWHVTNGVSAIPKSVNPARLRENLAAAAIELSTEERKRISELDRNFRYVPGDPWCLAGSPWTTQLVWE